MNLFMFAVILPLLSAPLIWLLHAPRQRSAAIIAVNAVVFLLTAAVFASPGPADALARVFGLLIGFVSLSAAIGSVTAEEPADAAISQVVLGGTLLGFFAGNIIILWAGAAVASVALALRAGWRPLIFASTGAALALFGSLLVFTANGAALDLAFVFILFGYGIQAALAGRARGLSGVLSLNLPLIAILRFSHLLRANPGAMQPGPVLLALGLAALFYAGFAFYRTRDAWRLSGICGLFLFAFGLGGVAAIFGGLLQMLLFTLIASGRNKSCGWLAAASVFALSGLPPSGLFASEFIIVSQTIQRGPWLTVPLGLSLLFCAAAILRSIGPLPAARPRASVQNGLAALHLALAFGIGFAMPAFLFRLLSSAASVLQ